MNGDAGCAGHAFRPLKEGTLTLDFTKVCSIGEIHDILKEALGLPDSYGRNWDALADVLFDRFMDEGERRIEVRGFAAAYERTGGRAGVMLRVFEALEEQLPQIKIAVVS